MDLPREPPVTMPNLPSRGLDIVRGVFIEVDVEVSMYCIGTCRCRRKLQGMYINFNTNHASGTTRLVYIVKIASPIQCRLNTNLFNRFLPICPRNGSLKGFCGSHGHSSSPPTENYPFGFRWYILILSSLTSSSHHLHCHGTVTVRLTNKAPVEMR